MGCLGVLLEVGDNPVDGLFHGIDASLLTGADASQVTIQFRRIGPHLGDHGLDGDTLFPSNLAADQVVGLNGSRPFVDGRDAGVAQVLGSTGFLDETHATMHLNAKRGNVDGALGTPALDHRNHQVGKSLPFLALDFIRIAVGVILRRRRHIGQCPHGLDA